MPENSLSKEKNKEKQKQFLSEDSPVINDAMNCNNYSNSQNNCFEITKVLSNRETIRNKLKVQFFWIIMISYIVFSLLAAILLIASFCLHNAIAIIAAVIGSLGTLLTCIITLPIIIAKNLFHENEKDNLEILSQLEKDRIQQTNNQVEIITQQINNDINNQQSR